MERRHLQAKEFDRRARAAILASLTEEMVPQRAFLWKLAKADNRRGATAKEDVVMMWLERLNWLVQEGAVVRHRRGGKGCTLAFIALARKEAAA